MKKIVLLLIILIESSLLQSIKTQVLAQSPPYVDNDCGFTVTCGTRSPNCKPDQNKNEILSDSKDIIFSFDLNKISPSSWNAFPDENGDGNPDIFDTSRVMTSFPDASWACENVRQTGLSKTSIITDPRGNAGVDCNWRGEGAHTFHLNSQDNVGKSSDLCLGNYSVLPVLEAEIKITSTTGLQDVNSQWKVEVVSVKTAWSDDAFDTWLDGEWLNNDTGNTRVASWGNLAAVANSNSPRQIPYHNISADLPVSFTLKALPVGQHTITLKEGLIWGKTIKSASFTVLNIGQPTPTLTPTLTPTPVLLPGQPTFTPAPPVPKLAPLCDQLGQYSGPCWNCVNQGKIWTAIGCLPTDLSVIIRDYVFTVGVGIAGTFAFLYFIYGIFLILTSTGEAEKIAEAKEIIISALSGLLLIIFSVFLLRVIGIDILHLPGFG